MNEYRQLINDVYEKDGTLYFDADGTFEPIKFNDHCGNEKAILNRENVRSMGWEVDTNSETGRTFLPSECFCDNFPIPDFNNDEFETVLDYFKEELEAADEAALEELVPMEKEAIQERFSEFLDWPEIAIFKGWTDEDRIVAFMNELNYGFYRQKWPKPSFHNDNEVREICRKWLSERSAQWRLGSERGFYYQTELK